MNEPSVSALSALPPDKVTVSANFLVSKVNAFVVEAPSLVNVTVDVTPCDSAVFKSKT